MTTRRQFLGGSAAVLAASMGEASDIIGRAESPLEILFLGGTGFIGPHQINRALARGHKVTMFNRGRRNGLFDGKVEQLVGDRDSNVGDGLQALAGKRRWDIVVDNSGYVPRHVRDSAELLKNRCGHYIYISTVAVYDFDRSGGRIDIDSPMHAAPEPATEEVNGRTYGPLKAECDRIVQDTLGDRMSSVRPTYVIGPGDSTDRFTYWVDRMHRGGDMVCPNGPDLYCNWVDVNDLANFVVHLGEQDSHGIFNAVTPAGPVTRAEVLHAIKATTTSDTRLHWPTMEQLEAAGFNPPMFPVTATSEFIDSSRAKAAGMDMTPLAESVQKIHGWWTGAPAERRANPRRWPTAEQEQAVLDSMS